MRFELRSDLFVGLLVGAAALLPLTAAAQTNPQGSSDSYNARTISDPLYLPLKGEFYGATVYTVGTPQGDNIRGTVQTGSFTSSNSLINQTIEYGITRDLTVRLMMGYAWNERDSTSAATGNVTTGNSHGF